MDETTGNTGKPAVSTKKPFRLGWVLLGTVLIAVIVGMCLPPIGHRRYRAGPSLQAMRAAGGVDAMMGLVAGEPSSKMPSALLGVSQAVAADPAPLAAPDTKLIYNANMQLSVSGDKAGSFADDLGGKVKALGGYVSESYASTRTNEQPRGRVTVRVPSAQLDELVSWVRSAAVVLDYRRNVQDITEHYVDLEARLGNLRQAETRLQDLLNKATGKLEEVLKVEEEIRKVRQEIEQLQGKKRLWDSQIAFSTVTVDYSVEVVYRAQRPTIEGFRERIKREAKESWRSFVKSSEDVAVAAVWIGPWAPIILIGLLIAWWILRRLIRSAARAVRG